MKGPLILTLFFTVFLTAPAQVNIDSVQQKLDIVFQTDLDSLQNRLTNLPDSLLPSYHKIDSIRKDFNLAAESLRNQYTTTLSNIDAETNRLSTTVDSLRVLKLPASRYAKSIDSLNRIRESTETKFTSRLNELQAKTTGKLQSLDLPAEYKEPLQKLTENINELNLNTDIVKIPSLAIPGYSLPETPGLGDVTSKVSEMGNIDKVGHIADIKAPMGDLGNVTEHLQGYQDDFKNITQGNLDDVQKLPETIEDQASRIDGMDDLQRQSGLIDEQKAKLDDLSNPEKSKEKAVEVAKKAAVDHFAGKQEQLKAAMEKVAKYKQKYSSVSSIKDLPKRPPNPMKGKPFIERLIPGLYLQYQRKNFYLLDVNPYIGHKLSGRITTGVGWNHRYTYDKDNRTFTSRSRIFGPRAYVDVKLGKGFIAHLEGETMNTFVPLTLLGNPDTGHREWVWSCMTGLKKEYKIYRNLKGTALIQYNLFNRYYKAPYVDRLNSRIGFEYVLKAKAQKRKP
jgi:hypothetical protein